MDECLSNQNLNWTRAEWSSKKLVGAESAVEFCLEIKSQAPFLHTTGAGTGRDLAIMAASLSLMLVVKMGEGVEFSKNWAQAEQRLWNIRDVRS